MGLRLDSEAAIRHDADGAARPPRDRGEAGEERGDRPACHRAAAARDQVDARLRERRAQLKVVRHLLALGGVFCFLYTFAYNFFFVEVYLDISKLLSDKNSDFHGL